MAPASGGSEVVAPNIAKKSAGCITCGFCDYYIHCPGSGPNCVGCGACLKGCPTGARVLTPVAGSRASVEIRVDGESHSVPGNIGLAGALATVGVNGDERFCCGTGGCGACAVLVDGRLTRPCCTGVSQGMEIVTNREAIDALPPLRVVSFFPGHLHASMSLFTHGCNYSCDFCHNWDLAFSSSDRALTPEEAAQVTEQMIQQMAKMQQRDGAPGGDSGNRRTGISGGEPTLNRRWLVEYMTRLKATTPDVRIQLDTNASVLTPDYVDELFAAGMTDISPDLKGLTVETFRKITGVADPELAARYLDTSWRAVEYVLSEYADRLHVVVAVPYHPEIITGDEVLAMAHKLAAMKKNLDVNLIVYQPAFRRRAAAWAGAAEVDEVVQSMKSTGLTVWLQTGKDIPRAVTPDDLQFSSEDFL